MKWVILIIMAGNFSPLEHDAIEIKGYSGNSLHFQNLEECRLQVKQNYISLSLFALQQFPGKKVDTIACFEKTEI